MSPELPEPVISRWRWRTFDNSSWTYSPVPAWADERIEVEHFHPANHLRAALATQAEAHAGELSRMQAEFDTACIALQGETAVERHKVEAMRAEIAQWKAAGESSMQFARDKEIELTEAREQLSAHDAIRAGLEADVAALRETNERFGKRQEWWNDQMFALEQERDALRDTLSAIETCAERAIGCTASEMDDYMVQISHAARTGSKP